MAGEERVKRTFLGRKNKLPREKEFFFSVPLQFVHCYVEWAFHFNTYFDLQKFYKMFKCFFINDNYNEGFSLK